MLDKKSRRVSQDTYQHLKLIYLGINMSKTSKDILKRGNKLPTKLRSLRICHKAHVKIEFKYTNIQILIGNDIENL